MTIATIGLFIAFALVLAAIAIVAMAGAGRGSRRGHASRQGYHNGHHTYDDGDDGWSFGFGSDDDGGDFGDCGGYDD